MTEQDKPQDLDLLMSAFGQAAEQLDALDDIDSDEQFATVGNFLLDSKAHAKSVESRRDDYLKPLKDRVAQVGAWFKPVVDSLSACESAAKSRMVSYLEAYEKRRDAAAEAGADIPPPPPELPGISVRESWAFDVIAADLLPREYLVPDPKLIRAKLKEAKQGKPEPIPGVKFYRSKTIVVTVR